MKGIVMLAVLKPTYGKFAFNLRTSLRFHNPDVPVQLIHDEAAVKHLKDWQLDSFEEKTLVGDDVTEFNGRNEPGRYKAFLYDKYKWDETLFIDVDSLMLKPISFDWDQNFHALVSPTNYWLGDEKYKKHFRLKKDAVIPATNTTFLYVKKGMDNAKLFKQWQKNFDKPIKKEDKPENGEWFNGLTPDEPYLNAALAKQDINPDFGKPMIFCKWKYETMPTINEVEEVGMSFWGHPGQIHHEMMKSYDRVMAKYMREIWGTNKTYNAQRLIRDKV